MLLDNPQIYGGAGTEPFSARRQDLPLGSSAKPARVIA
jgi:hypothetical protein